ncbi:hypothetical protein CG719_24145 [Streptomyces sp. CB01373]|nr:hypothetical protein CG719_24145 [Streptomyces sp. CB01373]
MRQGRDGPTERLGGGTILLVAGVVERQPDSTAGLGFGGLMDVCVHWSALLCNRQPFLIVLGVVAWRGPLIGAHVGCVT